MTPPDTENISEKYHAFVSSEFFSFYKNPTEMQCYPINLIEMSADFKRRLKRNITNRNKNAYFK